ncbi:MAG: DUF4350 domain-containing protein [Chloroflexi bacterium]|nr:DUF4350 domain-containing protein [Chloroflexota bacterium]
MRFNKQLTLSLALLLLLVVFAGLFSGPSPTQAYDLDANNTGGLRALRLWLEKMDYTVERMGNRNFALPDDVSLLFVYPNLAPFTREEATLLHEWVRNGHTLVMIGPTEREVALVDTFGVASTANDQFLQASVQQQPLLPASAPSFRPSNPNFSVLDLAKAPDAVAVLATEDKKPLIAVRQLGRGTIWHLTEDFALTNEQLRDKNVAALVPALLRTAVAPGKLLFDTYHLYGPDLSEESGHKITTLQEWLYGTPFGRATLFALGTILLYLVLQGRRLGPALPAQNTTRRREAAEYVAAMAALYRRAQQREAVAQHHKRRLKLGLGRSAHISPDLADTEFIQRFQATNQQLRGDEVQTVEELLRNLDKQTNEGALVQMVAKIDEVLAKKK